MKVSILFAALSALSASVLPALSSRIDVSFGAGFSEPEGRAGNNLDMGWNLDIRGGYKPSPRLALDLDFNYNRWNLNGPALARYGEPDGYSTIWSVSFLPVLRGSPHWHLVPYVMGGPGIYYRRTTSSNSRQRRFLVLPRQTAVAACYPDLFQNSQRIVSAQAFPISN